MTKGLCPFCDQEFTGRFEGTDTCPTCGKCIDWDVVAKFKEQVNYWQDKYIRAADEIDQQKFSIRSFKAASAVHKATIKGLNARLERAERERDQYMKDLANQQAAELVATIPVTRRRWWQFGWGD